MSFFIHSYILFAYAYGHTWLLFKCGNNKNNCIKKTEKGEKIKDFNKHVSWQVAEKRIKRGKEISNVVLNISEFLASILKSKKAAFRAN